MTLNKTYRNTARYGGWKNFIKRQLLTNCWTWRTFSRKSSAFHLKLNFAVNLFVRSNFIPQITLSQTNHGNPRESVYLSNVMNRKKFAKWSLHKGRNYFWNSEKSSAWPKTEYRKRKKELRWIEFERLRVNLLAKKLFHWILCWKVMFTYRSLKK